MTKKINEQQLKVPKSQNEENKKIRADLLGWGANAEIYGIYSQRLVKCQAERKLSKEMSDDK